MAKALIAMRPLVPLAVTSAGGFDAADVVQILTPNPKQVGIAEALPNNGSILLRVDMGAVVNADTFYLGFANSATPQEVTVWTASAAWANLVQVDATRAIIESALTPPIRHGFVYAPAPVASRYWNISLINRSGGALDLAFGVLAMGKSFKCALGHEQGAGRSIEDTSTVERLFSGGFGINEGAIVGGYQWTFGDLTDAEREELYALARGVGQSRSILVVEDPDYTAGLAERIHWGLFDRLSPFERLSPGLTRWELRIRDWG